MQVLMCVGVSVCRCMQMLMPADAGASECTHKTIIFIYLQRYQYLKLLVIEIQN